MTDSPRIPPIRGRDDVAPEHQAIADRVLAFFGAIRGPFSMLLHSPVLANQLLDVVEDIREQTIVSHQHRVLAILATVRERNPGYVWSAQVGYARRVGLREEAIDVIRARGSSAALTEEEREIVDYARELAQTDRVSQAGFDALRNRHGDRWLVELTASAQFYNALCGVVNAFQVPVPEDGDRLP
jgi:4-carboxymuconolactone decarboxylase